MNNQWVPLLISVVAVCTAATGWAYTPEKEFLQLKGYSPELIDTAHTQRFRQEWRYPPPPYRTPRRQMLRNVVINDWFGNKDPFGSYKIREKQ